MADLSKINFTATENYMKRSSISGSTTITLGAFGSNASATITHNLGYPPFFEVFCDIANDATLWASTKINQYTDSSLSGVYPPDPELECWVTDTVLTINLRNDTSPTATGTRFVRYTLYLDYGGV